MMGWLCNLSNELSNWKDLTESVGAFIDGSALGFIVGSLDKLGSVDADGSRLGLSVGSPVKLGSKEGSALGCVDGKPDGMADTLGCTEGSNDGIAVIDGFELGCGVACSCGSWAK